MQSLTAHPGPGSSEAHPAGRMIGIGLRARESPSPGGARSQGKGLKVNTVLRGLVPRSRFPLANSRQTVPLKLFGIAKNLSLLNDKQTNKQKSLSLLNERKKKTDDPREGWKERKKTDTWLIKISL